MEWGSKFWRFVDRLVPFRRLVLVAGVVLMLVGAAGLATPVGVSLSPGACGWMLSKSQYPDGLRVTRLPKGDYAVFQSVLGVPFTDAGVPWSVYLGGYGPSPGGGLVLLGSLRLRERYAAPVYPPHGSTVVLESLYPGFPRRISLDGGSCALPRGV
jgi:hypothetical protein